MSVLHFRGKEHRPRKREGVFLALPSMSNRINIGLHCFAMKAMLANFDSDSAYSFAVQHVNKKYPIDYARNLLCGLFLKTESDRLWFFDEDMMPEDDAFQLLGVDADIVAARAMIWDAKTDTAPPRLRVSAFDYNRNQNELFTPLIPMPGEPQVKDVDAVGTATMLIRRRVLEDRRMWTGDSYTDLFGAEKRLSEEMADPNWGPPIFHTKHKPNGQPLRGEDLDFCQRAKALGYSVKVHFGIGVPHLKEVSLDDIAVLAHNALTMQAQENAKSEVAGA